MTTKAATRDEFPVDSFRDAATHLRRPFTAAAVKFKVQAAFPKGNPQKAIIVCYIDARLAIERLNLVCPQLWTDEYERTQKGMKCNLTVDGLTRMDVGESGHSEKGQFSDAFKRAAVKFGIGVSLYATPKITLAVADGHLKEVKNSRDGDSLALTMKGEKVARDIYTSWLASRGAEAFGEPLDHGDVLDAQGDHEVGELPPEDIEAEPAPGLDADSTAKVIEAIKAAQMPHDWIRMQLIAAGAHDVPEGNVTLGTIRSLSPEQALSVIAVCEEHVAEAGAPA